MEIKNPLGKPQADSTYLKLDTSNGPLLDNLAMSGNRIVNLGDPISGQDAATKQWALDYLSSGGHDEAYLRLDTTNDPLTGDLHSSGAAIFAPDTDTVHTFGRAKISGISDYAFFSHYDKASITDYGFGQNSTGDALFNCSTGRWMFFRCNNVDIWQTSSTTAIAFQGAARTIAAAVGYNLNIKMGDTSGASKISYQDSNAVERASIDSDGGAVFAGGYCTIGTDGLVTSSRANIGFKSVANTNGFGSFQAYDAVGSIGGIGVYHSGHASMARHLIVWNNIAAGNIYFQQYPNKNRFAVNYNGTIDLIMSDTAGAGKVSFQNSTPTEVAYIDSSGRASFAPDTDTTHTFGRAKIGYPIGGVTDYVYFGHYDNFGSAGAYALAQGAAGTYLNAAASPINFCISGVGVWQISSTGVFQAYAGATKTIAAAVGFDLNLRMGDTSGASKISYIDSSLAEVGYINSDGNAYFAGGLGVGQPPNPSDRLVYLYKLYAPSVTTSFYGSNESITHNAAYIDDTSVYGRYMEVNTQGSYYIHTTRGQMLQMKLQNTSVNNETTYGYYNFIACRSSGRTGLVFGVASTLDQGASSSGSTVGKGYCFTGNIQSSAGAGSFDEVYGLSIGKSSWGGTGTIGKMYAIYIEPTWSGAVSDNWSIYSATTSPSYFAGAVYSSGGVTASGTLNVDGNIQFLGAAERSIIASTGQRMSFICGGTQQAHSIIFRDSNLNELMQVNPTYVSMLKNVFMYADWYFADTDRMIAAGTGCNLKFRLGDNSGASKISYIDSGSIEIASINSDGVASFAPDTDTDHVFGRVKIGYGSYTDYAVFKHFDMTNANYALMQSNDGRTYINASATKGISFGFGNTWYWNITTDALSAYGADRTIAAAAGYDLFVKLGGNTIDDTFSIVDASGTLKFKVNGLGSWDSYGALHSACSIHANTSGNANLYIDKGLGTEPAAYLNFQKGGVTEACIFTQYYTYIDSKARLYFRLQGGGTWAYMDGTNLNMYQGIAFKDADRTIEAASGYDLTIKAGGVTSADLVNIVDASGNKLFEIFRDGSLTYNKTYNHIDQNAYFQTYMASTYGEIKTYIAGSGVAGMYITARPLMLYSYTGMSAHLHDTAGACKFQWLDQNDVEKGFFDSAGRMYASGSMAVGSAAAFTARLTVYDNGMTSPSCLDIYTDDMTPWGLRIGNKTYDATYSGAITFYQRNTGEGYIGVMGDSDALVLRNTGVQATARLGVGYPPDAEKNICNRFDWSPSGNSNYTTNYNMLYCNPTATINGTAIGIDNQLWLIGGYGINNIKAQYNYLRLANGGATPSAIVVQNYLYTGNTSGAVTAYYVNHNQIDLGNSSNTIADTVVDYVCFNMASGYRATMSRGYGVRIYVGENALASGAISNMYGMHIGQLRSGVSTIANQYGIFIENSWGGATTDNYAIYSQTISPSYFAGKVDIATDTDITCTIGRAKIGYDGATSDYAMFAHYDMATANNYALLQGPTGNTFLNAASSKAIYFRLNNSDQWGIASDGNLKVLAAASRGIYAAAGYNLNIVMGDTSGASKVSLQDSTPTEMAYINSDGVGFFNSNIGIGVAPSNYITINSSKNYTTSSAIYGIYNYSTLSRTENVGTEDYGVYSWIRKLDGFNNTANMCGVKAVASYESSGKLAYTDAIHGYSSISTSSVQSGQYARGIVGYVWLRNTNTGNLAGAYGMQCYYASTTGAAGTITDLQLCRLSISKAGSETLTNVYGLYIDSTVTGGVTANYSIYNNSLAPSYFAGNMAIGVSVDTNRSLYVHKTHNLSAAENVSGITAQQYAVPTGVTTSNVKALRVDARVTAPSSGDMSYLYGIFQEQYHFGSGTIGTLYGYESVIAGGGAGPVTNARGITIALKQTTGSTAASTWATAKGMQITFGTDAGAGKITNGYGIYLEGKATGGAITNLYGLYLDAGWAGASTLNYAIYSASQSPSYLAGDLAIGVAGKGLSIKEGTNAKMGSAVLVSGSAVVSTTAVTATSRVFLTGQDGVTNVGFLYVASRIAGTSFTVNSSNVLDARAFAWIIVEPS